MRLQQKYKNLFISSLIFCFVLIGEKILYTWVKDSLPVFSKNTGFFRNLALVSKLKQENAVLKKSLLSLKMELRSSRELLKENQRLKSLLGLKNLHKNNKTVFCQVLARVPVSGRDYLIIDKGSADGITKGSIAVDAQGNLIGRVSSVRPKYSEVITVWNRNFKIGVKTAGDSGVFEGSILSYGRLKYLDYNTSVKPGDKVEVLNQQFANITLGYVSLVRRDEKTLSLNVFVKPSAKKTYLEDLLVLVNPEQ